MVGLLPDAAGELTKGHSLSLFHVFAVLIGILLYPSTAMAYIDPASGSAVIGAIIGSIVAVALAIKTSWYKLKAIFIRQETGAVEQSSVPKTDE